jgi:RNA polymerase sigma factor (sigma-70 family)
MGTPEDQILTVLRTHGPSLHALLWRLTLRHDVAEDLMQELFLRLAHARQFVTAEDPAAYAARVAINLALDWRRRGARMYRHVAMPTDMAGAVRSPLAALLAAEETQAVLGALSELRGLGREVLVMHYVQEEPYEVIARCLDKDVHQVRALAHKALAKLRSRLRTDKRSKLEARHDQ